MKIRFNVKCRVDGESYAVGDEADLSDYEIQQLSRLRKNGVAYVSVVEEQSAPVETKPKAKAKAKPKAKAKAKAKTKAKPKAKRKKETATE